MRNLALLLVITLGMVVCAKAQEQGLLLPAGKTLDCTLEGPNLSSRTAQRGTPVLCDLDPTDIYGFPIFSTGGYLAGRLRNYRDPGHFFGKGWFLVQLNRLVLPTRMYSLRAQVVAAPPYKVDREGRIRGRGHAIRDTVEWMIPPLWPEKIITFPLRGPFPTLRSESRITVRLLDDVYLPNTAAMGVGPLLEGKSQGKEDAPQMGLNQNVSSSYVARGDSACITQWEWSCYDRLENPATAPQVSNLSSGRTATQRYTFLIFTNGSGVVATSYRVEGAWLRYTTVGGYDYLMPLSGLDIGKTTTVNRERGVQFALPVEQGPAGKE